MDSTKDAYLQDILVDLADSLEHGVHFAACGHNGTLVRVHHALHSIWALRLWGVDLGRQVQHVVPLPDVGADHLQHSAFGLQPKAATLKHRSSYLDVQRSSRECKEILSGKQIHLYNED